MLVRTIVKTKEEKTIIITEQQIPGMLMDVIIKARSDLINELDHSFEADNWNSVEFVITRDTE